MPRRKRTSRKGTKRRVRRRVGGKRSKVRIVRGKIAIRVKGFPGVHHIGTSDLVHRIALSHVRKAAKSYLNKFKKHHKRRVVHRRKRRTRRSK